MIESDSVSEISRIRLVTGQAVNSLNSKSPTFLNQLPQLMGRIIGHAFVLKHDTDTKSRSLWTAVWKDLLETENRTVTKFEPEIVKRICQTMGSQRRLDRTIGASAALAYLDIQGAEDSARSHNPSSFFSYRYALVESSRSSLLRYPSTESTPLVVRVGLRAIPITVDYSHGGSAADEIVKMNEASNSLLDTVLNIIAKSPEASTPDFYAALQVFVRHVQNRHLDQQPQSLSDSVIARLMRMVETAVPNSSVSNNCGTAIFKSLDLQRWKLWVSIICYQNPPQQKISRLPNPTVVHRFLSVWIAAVSVVENDKQLSELLSILTPLIQHLSQPHGRLLVVPGDDLLFVQAWKPIQVLVVSLLHQQIDNRKPCPSSSLQLFSLLVDLLTYVHSAVTSTAVNDASAVTSAVTVGIVDKERLNEIESALSLLITLDGFGKYRRLILEADKLCDAIKSQINASCSLPSKSPVFLT